MTEQEFDEKMEHYDTYSEYKVLNIMDSGDAYDDFKEYMVHGKGSK